MHDFKSPSYLKGGNKKQKQAYNELQQIGLFNKLGKYNPVLCGTIPIGIDIENSDLDIICYSQNLEKFEKDIIANYSMAPNFSISRKRKSGQTTVISRFKSPCFLIEIFGQNTPVEKQMAYRHMLIEAKILEESDVEFRKSIIELKKSGIKTEPAFAKLLGLDGDPYQALLAFE